MKPVMQDEIEDDLAAEEENKIINEVSSRFRFVCFQSWNAYPTRNTKHGKLPGRSPFFSI
jgi:hypothetical protein